MDVLSDDHKEHCDQLFKEIIQNPNKVFNIEVDFKSKKGEIINLSGNITCNNDGGVISTRAIFHDVTERKRLLAEIQEREQNFQYLADSMNEVFWLADPKRGGTVYVNSAYEKIYEVPGQTLIDDPTSWSNQIDAEDLDRVEKAFTEKTYKGTFNEQYKINTPSGKTKWIQAKAIPIKDQRGEVIRISGISSDITEQKLNELRTEKIKE